MRIADKMQFEQVKTNIGKNRSQMSELQNQAATQKRVTKPSDDPLAASRVLSSRIDLQGSQQFLKSLNYAKSFLEYTDQSLGDVTEIVNRAKELAISQSNDGSSNQETRRAIATEIEQLYSALVNIGNRKLGDRFIFGGFHTQNPPFSPSGDYHGDMGEMNIHVDKEAFVPMNVPGARIFLGRGFDEAGTFRQSPPQARSLEELNAQLAKEGRRAEPASEPTSSKLPNQPPGEPRGPASLTSPELPGSGTEVQPQGGANLFSILRDLEISLKTDDKGGIQESLDELDGALSQVILTRSQVGSRSMALENMMQSLDKAKVDHQTTISSLEDADVLTTVSDLSKTQATLQATLQTSGKLIQPSLLEFLR